MKIIYILSLILFNSLSIQQALASSISIDGVSVRGGPVDGSICCQEIVFNRPGQYNLNDPRSFDAQLNLDTNYVYEIKVLSTAFLTEFGIHGADYQDPSSRPMAKSQYKSPFQDGGNVWSESVIAYKPTWRGDHWLKIKARHISPRVGVPVPSTGEIHVVVWRYRIQGTTQEIQQPCPPGQCGEASVFGSSNCRRSSPGCGGGMCGSMGCP